MCSPSRGAPRRIIRLEVLMREYSTRHGKELVISQPCGGAQKAERSHILIPIAKGRGSGERPATDDFADPAQDRLRQLRDRRFPLHGAGASVAILLMACNIPS